MEETTTAKLNLHSVVGPNHVKAKLISMLANFKEESYVKSCLEFEKRSEATENVTKNSRESKALPPLRAKKIMIFSLIMKHT